MSFMPKQISISEWGKIIYNNKNLPIDYNELNDKLLVSFSGEYERIIPEYSTTGYYGNLEDFINDFLNNIPEKLEKLQLKIRPWLEKFYSCIITDEEVNLLATHEHFRWVNKMYSDGWTYDESLNPAAKTHPDLTGFSNLDNKKQKFYRELIYTIPVVLNRCGFEVYKPAEQGFIKNDLIENLARAIHERYRILMREMDDKAKSESIYEKSYIVNVYNRQYFSLEYDQLPNDIKSSNIDSAYHIATKLLSIGYTIKETDRTTTQTLLFPGDTEIETMAKMEHERWAWEKRLKGFSYGKTRNDALKKHPCLVPYHELPELEKEKDRILVKIYPALLDDINYSVIPLSPEQLQNISYVPRQRVLLQESIAEIEKSILAIDTEDFNAKQDAKTSIRKQLTESLAGIRSAIEEQYGASQIQQCILPTRLFFRSCLPDSFILYKPRDILSGDFYFVSKVNNFVIFAAADCTGHGTAGAMLSMICSNFLDQAVNDNRLTDPSMIISFVYKKLVAFMKRHDKSVVSDYGMEIAICTIIPETRTLFYAGINRPLYIFGNSYTEILEPQKIRTGDGYESLQTSMKQSQQVNLQKGDTLYAFSDGYADQFGGKENKKFMTRNLEHLLKTIQPEPMLGQYEILNSTIEQWKRAGTENAVEQMDDILVIGVRL